MKTLLFFIQILTISVFSQANNSAFNTFLKNEQVKPASISFKVYNISQNKNIVSYNTQKLLNPASVQKLVTTSAALNILGKDFSYNTKVNFKGEMFENTFKGIIEILASGDPSLDKKFINEIYEYLKSKSITKIEGYIIVKETIFDNTIPQTWLVEDIANYYASPAYSFNYLKNTYKLTFQQSEETKQPSIKSIFPFMRNLKFENKLVSASENSGDNAYIIGLPFSNKRQIVGTIPAGKSTFSIKGAMNNPAQIFKNDLIKKFQEENFGFVFNSSMNNKKILFTLNYKSEKLEKILKLTNQKSINLYAESLLKTIGYKKYNFGTTENGIKAIKNIYNNEQIIIYDGSGLSRKNLLSTEFINDILVKNKTNTIFKNSLGVSGISGTMKYFRSDKTKGKIFAKSGSADNILNYAGYFTNVKGEEFSFVLFVNNYIGDRKQLREEIIKLMETFL